MDCMPKYMQNILKSIFFFFILNLEGARISDKQNDSGLYKNDGGNSRLLKKMLINGF